ncbi:hypothetical protein DFH29DRAFT_806327, partial [Suillus ampliporus]
PQHMAAIVDMTIEQCDRTISANLTLSFLCRDYLRHLRAAVDSVRNKTANVLIASTSPMRRTMAITLSVRVVIWLTLNSEIVKIGPKGRANCVALRWVAMLMIQEALNDPSANCSTPEDDCDVSDIANQISILSSSVVSGHVTGQVIIVEGGCVGDL